MLSDYGVENAGTKIIDKEKDIFNIELPFIAHLGGEFVIVYKIEPEKVHFLWNGKQTVLPLAEFLNAWSGIILLAEPTANAIEPDYKEHKKKELLDSGQKGLLAFAAGLLFVLSYITNGLFANLGLTLLLLLNFAGVYIAYLLILKQLHIHSRYADKICSLFKQHDCNDVLESKAAKLWNTFGWSEIGFGYFAANILILLFLPNLISYLALINILALPYSFWSVWYQKMKAKQWCVLCLIVQALLWGVFILSWIFGLIRLPDFSAASLVHFLLLACVYGISILIINILVPKLSEGRMVVYLKQEINSIKANEDVFKAILNKQPYYEVSKSDSQILFGNPDAALQITILTNPYCNPCAGMHKRVEEILKDTNNTICVQYIFSSFDKSLDFANKYLIAACMEKNQSDFRQIIGDWFEKGKPLGEEFFKKLSLDVNNPAVESEFQKHEVWREKTKLRATPTVLVNGYQLPGNYRIEDLKQFTKFNVDVK
jgi:protein-disulfide isomerase